MADQLKEIYAGTLTVADIATNGSATLATTDANTQYVIKDVSVSGVFATGNIPVLKVNDFSVADLSTNATGSEIVDVSSAIKYQAFSSAPNLTATAQKFISGANGTFTDQDLLTYSINGVATSVTATSTAITTAMTNYGTSLNYAKSSNGSLFYIHWDGNSSTALYKRTGGVNGSQTTITSLSYGWIVFNGVDTYYYASSADTNTLYKYNINTGATTSASIGVTIANSSYPSASMMNNGKILVNYSGNSQTSELHIIDPVANTYTTITGLASVGVSGTTYKISGYYNATTNRYTLYKRVDSTLYKTTLNGVLTIGTAYSGGVTNTSHSIGTIGGAVGGNFNVGYVAVDSNNYSLAKHGENGKTDLITFNTLTNSASTAAWLAYRTDMDTFIQNTTTATAVSNFTNTVNVRITGVKSTI